MAPQAMKKENKPKYKTVMPTVRQLYVNKTMNTDNSNRYHIHPEHIDSNIDDITQAFFSDFGFVGTLMDRI